MPVLASRRGEVTSHRIGCSSHLAPAGCASRRQVRLNAAGGSRSEADSRCVVRAFVLARTLGWFEAVHPVLGVWPLAITVAVPG